MKKKFIALGIACGLSLSLAAEAPSETNVFFGVADALVIEESAPIAADIMCSGKPRGDSAECWAPYRAVLVAHVRKGSAMRGTGTWL